MRNHVILVLFFIVIANALAEQIEVPWTRQTLISDLKLDVEAVRSFARTRIDSGMDVIVMKNVILECSNLNTYLSEELGKSTDGLSVDFLLIIHPDARRGLNPQITDLPSKSFKLYSEHILSKKYEIVVFEGSVFDGFDAETQLLEVNARIAYFPTSPLYKMMVQNGITPGSSQAIPIVRKGIASTKTDSTERLFELQVLAEKNGAKFLSGELLAIHMLEGRLLGILSGQRTLEYEPIRAKVSRLRSAYAVAKVLHDLRERHQSRGAIVYGFLHSNEFKEFADRIGFNNTLIDLTGR